MLQIPPYLKCIHFGELQYYTQVHALLAKELHNGTAGIVVLCSCGAWWEGSLTCLLATIPLKLLRTTEQHNSTSLGGFDPNTCLGLPVIPGLITFTFIAFMVEADNGLLTFPHFPDSHRAALWGCQLCSPAYSSAGLPSQANCPLPAYQPASMLYHSS